MINNEQTNARELEIVAMLHNSRLIPITRPERLKVFSILSSKKDVDFEPLRKSLHFSLVAAFNKEEADRTNLSIMQQNGHTLTEWNPSQAVVWSFFDDLIPVGHIARMLGTIMPPILRGSLSPLSERPLPPTPEERGKKSAQELGAYVRYVFESALPEEKKVAEKVISQFLKKYNAEGIPSTGASSVSAGDQKAGA